MKSLIRIPVLLLFLCSCSNRTPATTSMISNTIPIPDTVSTNQSDSPSFYGYWTPVNYLFGDISALDSAQTEALMKKKVYLGEDIAVMFGDTLYSPIYTSERVNAAIWAQEMRSSKKQLGITKDSVFNIGISFKMKSGNSSFREFAFDGISLITSPNGPYILLVRDESKRKYSGTGNTAKEIPLIGKEKILHLSYEFFSDPDELVVYDQTGKELYHSAISSTTKEEKVTISLDKVTKLTIKINSKLTNSRWKFIVETL